MKLYLLSQDDNLDYDTYDSCVVCAENEEDAKTITPDGKVYVEDALVYIHRWAKKKSSITCKEIGTANEGQERGVVLASFNAG